MRTDYLKIKLETILRKLIYSADIERNIELTYTDRFTAKSALDMVITVNLYISDNGGHEENCLSVIEFESCSVDKFEVLDESGNPMCDNSQLKDLVKYANDFMLNYYSNL